ncbi:outer membrane protein assembly factor BamE [Povalibacter uvarum]|uniref:Outer membrane protein assembly factor BamE n=1 Tax=Povalibacter uvarum TaxID=732238 RepID=A0A841HH21_9GAMM|nr:outer membrane protein assembly factor BamE [Povalibacter uvarum]MBB6091864.1 outer membrane protein assembly factor BamE [Povalibacter uvarum]
MTARKLIVAALLTTALIGGAGCVHRIDIQQGNFLEPKDVDRVAVGMTRVQVRALLGTPMVADPFETQRWDYIYYLKRGRLADPIHRQFTVYFEEDKVVRVDRSDKASEKDGAATAQTAEKAS